MGESWSNQEIDLIVADYFAMLIDELSGVRYVKTDHNRELQKLIPRDRSAIEFKHRNISAVLRRLGQPWIDGYKPADNFQLALVDGVWRWLDARPDWLTPRAPSRVPGHVAEASVLWIGPPPTQSNEPPPIDVQSMLAIARKYDVAARDARNRALGAAGEALVLDHERQTLRSAGRHDLADRVRWSAVEDGDGLGYDIASFERDGRERLIEVKTTNGWDRTPFHITRNELTVADERRDDWHLIRVWNFAREPRGYALRPPLDPYVELTATTFLADLR